MKLLLNLSLMVAILSSFASCKTTEESGSNLQSAKNDQEIGAEVFGCYKVNKIDSTSNQPVVAKLKTSAKQVCLSNKPLNLTITDSEKKDLLTWAFKGIEPMRCPGCYQLTGGNEYSATITRTAVALIFNMSLDSRGLGGNVRLTLQQILDNPAAADASTPKFTTISCGDHWQKITGIMPTKTKDASIKLSGDSLQKTIMLPAKVLRKGDEWVFEATEKSGASLRITNESGKFYGVFRDSKVNDEKDLGQCYGDVVPESPLN